MADQTDDATPAVASGEAEINAVLGLFDVPAFARRGADLDYALDRLHRKLGRERSGMLDMVRMRLKQWAALANGPDDWRDAFAAPVYPLYEQAGAGEPSWAPKPASGRKRRAAARDLIASVDRFDKRWRAYLDAARLDSVNRQIDAYNRYYVFEKECVVGSARLAARLFVPKPEVTREGLAALYPPIPVPSPAGS